MARQRRRQDGTEATARLGRPRAFDRTLALQRAKRLFWEKGFTGTQVTDLTHALGISPPSLYAAFGDKKALFHEVVALYLKEDMAIVTKMLAQPDVFDAFRSCLVALAKLSAGVGNPAGCLLVTGAMNYSPEDQLHMQEIGRIRSNIIVYLQARLTKAVGDSQLNQDTNVKSLALFLHSFINGMAVRAKDGASLDALIETVEFAMLPLYALRQATA